MGVCCSCACWKTCCVSDWELQYWDNFNQHEEEFRALRFEINETRKVYRVFRTIDRKNIGWIDYRKVLSFCKINETPFVKSIFVVFDKRKTSYICFRDFFMIIYDYCTLAPQQLGGWVTCTSTTDAINLSSLVLYCSVFFLTLYTDLLSN